jgi:putative hydrolase of the HAD superfamily
MSKSAATPVHRHRLTLFYDIMQIKFLYFDLGKVLVNFDVDRMLGQVAAVAGVSAEQVRGAIFGDGLLRQFERGQLTNEGFYESFCASTGSRPDINALAWAAADIFELNLPVLPLVAQLRQAGYPMGILSNTCEIHWQYCAGRYRIVAEGFPVHALSYRIQAVKPDAAIFHAAADLAGCRPDEIFFVDDIAEHVAGARAVGFDAVQFTSAEQLADDLRRRGIRFNY